MPAVSHRTRARVQREIVKPSIVTPEWYRTNVIEKRQALRRELRQVSAALQAFRITGIDTYNAGTLCGIKRFTPGPIAQWKRDSWTCEPYRSLTRRKRQFESELAALEELYPTPGFWKPRPETAADKRIAKRYDKEATPTNFRFCRARDVQDYAHKRDALNLRDAKRASESGYAWVQPINVAMTIAYAVQREQWRDEWAAEAAKAHETPAIDETTIPASEAPVSLPVDPGASVPVPHLVTACRQIADRLEAVLRMSGATDAMIQTHPELSFARSTLAAVA